MERLVKISLVAVVATVFLGILCLNSWGEYGYGIPTTIGSADDGKSDKAICPVTKMDESCLSCHVLIKGDDGIKFGLKEVGKYSEYNFPSYTMVVDGRLTLYLEPMRSEIVFDFLQYAYEHPEFPKHVVIEVNSFGGSIFEGWRIKALMVEAEARGYIVETHVRGVALSAGFLVFVSGTLGHRTVDLNAECMMHELWTIEWPKVASPADKEHEATIYRHLQDNINQWIASRGNMTKEEIDTRLKFKEVWLTGKEMIDFGFADKHPGLGGWFFTDSPDVILSEEIE